MPTNTKPTTVLETILDWSKTRPMWQRDALRRIIVNGTPDDNDLKELLSLCKKEHGDTNIKVEADPLEAKHLPVDPGDGESIGLARLENVIGVNQLAPSQRLDLEVSGLTVIYGPNGTGKSGYSRIIKKACRARHAGEIMPDVYKPSPTGNATATLSISRADGTLTPIAWEDDGSPTELLSAITVFDRDCASVHVQKKNEVWFRPFGLDIPDDLAGICQQLKDILTSEKLAIERERNPIFLDPTWSSTSKIGKAMSTLRADSNMSSFVQVEEFSADKEARLSKLRADLQQDGKLANATQMQLATRLEQMSSYLKQVEANCSDAALIALYSLKSTATASRTVADAAATKAFGGLSLEGVGEPTWKSLWESARRYSQTVGDEGVKFPPSEGDACVVCHQNIDAATAARMLGFENFIKQDTETAAVEAEERLADAIQTFENFFIHSSKVNAARQSLIGENTNVARKVLKFLAIARLRKKQAVCQLYSDNEMNLTPLPPSPAVEIDAIVSATRTYAASLLAETGGSDRENLLNELADLSDQKQQKALLKIADAEIERLKQLQCVDDCLSDMSTTAITRLGNTIADDLITPRMRDKFREEIGALAGNRVRVEVVRSGGRFGSPQYEVRLYANPKAKVHDVLSEGEQTCVALASYLTELANASHNSALVFDDPVTSLDHKWRGNVAKRLIKEAKARQVVIFTHDLIFVNDLHQMALSQAIPLGLAHLSRGEEGVGVVNKELPWRASGVKERVDNLEKEARNAKRLHDVQDDESYRREAHGIYDRLRAAWERALEDIVFAGVILRHRDYINTKGLSRVTALEQSDVAAFNAGFKKCCDYVEAHDASRGRDADPPEPDEIMADIACLKTWSDALRIKMNAVK